MESVFGYICFFTFVALPSEEAGTNTVGRLGGLGEGPGSSLKQEKIQFDKLNYSRWSQRPPRGPEGGASVNATAPPQTQLQTPPTPSHHPRLTPVHSQALGTSWTQAFEENDSCFSVQCAVLLVRRASITLWMFSSGTWGGREEKKQKKRRQKESVASAGPVNRRWCFTEGKDLEGHVTCQGHAGPHSCGRRS